MTSVVFVLVHGPGASEAGTLGPLQPMDALDRELRLLVEWL